MDKQEKIKTESIDKIEAKAIFLALKDFYPKFYKEIIDFSRRKFCLEDYISYIKKTSNK